MKTTERVTFRHLHMDCCGTMLCWVNPRFPSYCPECGKHCYPLVKGMVTHSDSNAILKVNHEDR